MKYELALKLKEAGFPQEIKDNPIWENIYYKNGELVIGAFIESQLEQGMVKAPTLSELIEALGDRFVNLYRTPDGVFHCVNPFEDGEDTVGSTPEEAVANLWLALNKK